MNEPYGRTDKPVGKDESETIHSPDVVDMARQVIDMAEENRWLRGKVRELQRQLDDATLSNEVLARRLQEVD